MKKEIKTRGAELKTILVVEDEPTLQEAIGLKLKKEGYQHLPAFTAEDGIIMLENKKPDLVWLDLLLPGMGGFAFLEKVRQNPKFSELPIMIVSASASPEKIRHAFDLNVVDYLVKSQFQLGDIVKRLKTFIK